MKNRRFVCAATHAGYITYQGLSGRVRTGCPNMPAHKSKYCNSHKPIIAEVSNSDNSDSVHHEEPVGLITGKRTTRTSTHYQVSQALL